MYYSFHRGFKLTIKMLKQWTTEEECLVVLVLKCGAPMVVTEMYVCTSTEEYMDGSLTTG